MGLIKRSRTKNIKKIEELKKAIKNKNWNIMTKEQVYLSAFNSGYKYALYRFKLKGRNKKLGLRGGN
mgnify:CR=1 FL=1